MIAGEKFQTFSATADEGVTDRVRLEEKCEGNRCSMSIDDRSSSVVLVETNPQVRTVLMRDLEPIQGRSLVDFPDYVIKERR